MAAILRSARESATAMFGWSRVSEQRLRGESKLRPAAGRVNDPRLWEAILDRYPWDRQTPFLPVSPRTCNNRELLATVSLDVSWQDSAREVGFSSCGFAGPPEPIRTEDRL